jgi:hypothetical protein
MTAAYNPHADWAKEDRAPRSLYAAQPLLGDPCDIRIGTRYCHQPAVRFSVPTIIDTVCVCV